MFQVLTITLWLVFHPVHVSLTSIDIVPGTDSIKVFIRMYYDDLLLDNQEYMPESLSAGQNLSPGEWVAEYINKKVKIFADNKLIEGKLLNMNLADNEISLNIFYRSVTDPSLLTVRNLVMAGLYSDQANMVIVKAGNFEEGFKLTPETTELTVSLKRNMENEE